MDLNSLSLGFQAFFYDWIDRSHAKKGKPLPEKIGSMQYFLHGYQGEVFLSSMNNLKELNWLQMHLTSFGNIHGLAAPFQTPLTTQLTGKAALPRSL
jgi:hypothetical protein